VWDLPTVASGALSGVNGGAGLWARLGISYNWILPRDHWVALRLGAGVGLGGVGSKGGEGAFGIPLYVGVKGGIGSWSGARWRGHVLGFDYQPVAWITFTKDGLEVARMHYVGFALFWETVKLYRYRAREPNWRALSLSVAPPVGDLPLIVTFGTGVSWQ
jgi:hypothetical protein